MNVVRSLQAYLPAPELASAVATPPLGGLTAREWMRLSHDNPNSFLHVVRSEIDSVAGGPDPTIPPSRGRARLDEMIADGVLRPGPPGAFYLYGIDDGTHVAVGIVARVHVDAYRSGQVRRHEHTRASTEGLLVDHLERVGAHGDPVALTFPADDTIEDLVASVRGGTHPVLDFTTGDGTRQRVWVIDDPGAVAVLEDRLSRHRLYITDGHHRCAAAVRYAARRQRSGDTTGQDHEYFLAALYPERELTLHEFNRCLAGTGMSADQIVSAVGSVVTFDRPVTFGGNGSADPRPAKPGTVTMVVGDTARSFALPEPDDSGDLLGSLDAVRLQEGVLDPVFGIGDPRTDPRLRYVAGGEPTNPRRVDCEVCFLMFPTPLGDVMRIADAGLVMPPKSTWFEPKAWGGIFVSLLG